VGHSARGAVLYSSPAPNDSPPASPDDSEAPEFPRFSPPSFGPRPPRRRRRGLRLRPPVVEPPPSLEPSSWVPGLSSVDSPAVSSVGSGDGAVGRTPCAMLSVTGSAAPAVPSGNGSCPGRCRLRRRRFPRTDSPASPGVADSPAIGGRSAVGRVPPWGLRAGASERLGFWPGRAGPPPERLRGPRGPCPARLSLPGLVDGPRSPREPRSRRSPDAGRGPRDDR